MFDLKKSALLATTMLCSLPLQAQEAPPEPEAEEIVVTGGRLQNSRAIGVRADSTRVVDTVTSDELGQLPDFNVGEALQRLPGVAVQNDQAEARFVTVRAMNANYNYTTVDGLSIAVPDRNGRRVFMDVLPASLADRIDVVKTFTPELEGGQIGGNIDLRTASAFGQGRNHFELSAEIGKYDNDEGFNGGGPSGNANALYSTTFGSDDRFGLVVFGNYYRRDSYIPQAEWGGTNYFYNADGTSAGQPGVNTGVYPGTGFAVPGERRWYWYHNQRQRYGGGAKLEYRGADDSYLFVRGFYNMATDDEVRQTDILTHGGGGTLTNQTPTSGTLTGASNLSAQENLGQFRFERSVWALSGGGDHKLGEGSLKWRLNYSGSRFRNDENWAEWRMNAAGQAFSYERDGDVYHITPTDPAAFANYANYAPYRRQFDSRGLDEDLYEAKLDFDHPLGFLGEGWHVGAGAGVRRIDRSFDEERDRYLPEAGNSYTMAAADVVRTDQCLQPPGALAGQCLIVIDPARATRNFDAHLAANPAAWRFDEMANDDNNLDYTLRETVWSAYGLLRYSRGPVTMVTGLRYEDTQTDAQGRRRLGADWAATRNTGGYRHFLPSLNVALDLAPRLRGRAAYSKSIGRPAFNAIAPVGEVLNEDGDVFTLSRSNPDLKPREADNFDLALDWVIDRGQGILSAGLFHKRVKNEIFTMMSSQQITLDDGRTVTADVTQPTNAGRPVHIWGLELNAIKNLDFLPAPLDGLAVSANATFLKTDFQQRMNDGSWVELETMVGQPNTSYNLALLYDRGPISARLAFNHMGIKLSERLNTATTYRNRFDVAEDTLDFKIRYRVTDNAALTFNASNITGAGRAEVFGWDQELPMVKAEIGAAYFLGLAVNF